MTAFFISATGTDVGKTFVARGLIKVFRAEGHPVAALKPIVSGFEPAEADGSDSGLLLKALGEPVTPEAIARITPWRFSAPLAADLAAVREGRKLDYRELVEFCRKAIAEHTGTLLIEGIGGAMSPIDAKHTGLDWAADLGLPLILVAGSYLGTISHTLTALDVIARRGFSVACLVISESPDRSVGLDETCDAIARFAPQINVVALQRLPAGSVKQPAFAKIAERLKQ